MSKRKPDYGLGKGTIGWHSKDKHGNVHYRVDGAWKKEVFKKNDGRRIINARSKTD